MSEKEQDAGTGRYGHWRRDLPPSAPPQDDVLQALRRAAAQVMEIQDMTIGDRRSPIRLRGRLIVPAERAFEQLRPSFEAVGHTPLLRREEGMDVIRALPTVFEKDPKRQYRLPLLLLLATLVSVFYVGLQNELYLPIAEVLVVRITGDPSLASQPELLPDAQAWSEALRTGALYTLALIGILGAHEMGHYLMARYHKVHTTFPFFIPLPINILGTLGAVIAMREPSPNRRIQFDIGIAGPLAGLIVAVPVMLIGLYLSEVGTVQDVAKTLPEGVHLVTMQEGQSLAYLAMKYLVFGRVLPQGDLDVWVHPVAFAAWAGFLVTALNLMPVGQLDGGHVLYGLFGNKAQLARWPVIIFLALLALPGMLQDLNIVNLGFGWSGWLLWVLMIFFLLRGGAPVLDEITGLDGKRKALGVVMLVVFVLIFTPTPLVINPNPLAAVMGYFV